MAFRAFLQKEFSEENLDFWTEVETYKKQKSSKQAKLAPVIYKTYIAVNAPKEVNILLLQNIGSRYIYILSQTYIAILLNQVQ